MNELTNQAITNFKVTGVTIAWQQGDTRVSKYYKGINLADVADIVEAVEAQGEYTFVGFAPVYRLETFIDGTLTINQGTATKVVWSNVGLKRTAVIGEDEVEVKSLYLTLPISQDGAKNAPLVNGLVGKTLASAKVTEVMQNGSIAINTTASA